jgi:hypothetical protein
MKYFLLLAVAVSLSSCNTAIGIYRDGKQGFIWTKNKIQNSGNNSGGGGGYDAYGAPTY